MAPKLTRMADRIIIRFAAHDRRGLSKTLKGSFAGVSEAAMPSGRRWSGYESAGVGG